MQKELYFVLNEKEVFLEHILVDYDNIPIFLLCKDKNKQYYLALCNDAENQNYLVVDLSVAEVNELLHGKYPMRDFFLGKKEFWNIISGETIKENIVERRQINKLNVEDLPEERAYFQIVEKHVKEYVQKFDLEFSKKKKD